MKVQIIFKSARRITMELLEEGIVYAKPYDILIDGVFFMHSEKVVQSLGGLKPDTKYELQIRRADGCSEIIKFRTKSEFVTLNVKDFGAVGDGIHDDTQFIQVAINCCPPDSRVFIPAGTYCVGPLFLKDELTLDVSKGAVLLADTDYRRFPILPGLIDSYDEKREYNLGTWEGNPLEMFASIITGIHVQNVVITGEGILDGNASEDNWWKDQGRSMVGGAFRPRMIFLNHCKNVTVQGLRIQNSPAWTLHPYFSDNTRWIDLVIDNPKISPNTDGLDPESVNGLEVVGVTFSLGDDCIAVKSGKMYMGKKYKTPSQNIEIRQCHMKYGHGAVTLGSEIGAGVKHLHCHHCIFENTDRGFRLKTRRGRGEDSIVEDIVFDHIQMEGVLTPFALNCYYWCCDPDGRSEYVRSKDALLVDERTPSVKTLDFRCIEARNCHVAAAFIYGLPEQKIERITFKDINIDFAEEPMADYPEMMADVEPCVRKGIFINNCRNLILHNVNVKGMEGEAFVLEHVEEVDIQSLSTT